MIEAYVEGRPTPNSSIRFTSEASVNRAGGCVMWPSGMTSTTFTIAPTCRAGSTRSSSPSSGSSTSSR